MTQGGSRKRKFVVLLVLVLVAAGGWGWACRDMIQAWYWVRQLARAGEADRERLARRVADLGEPAVPRLLECLGESDEAVCANAHAGLDRLGARWGAGDK